MEKLFNPLKKKKKISFDIDEEFLRIIDELVNLTKCSRTVIIESLISQGMIPFFNYLENTWKRILDEGRYKEHEKMEKGIEKLLQNLKKIKSKYVWLNPSSWKKLLSKENLNEKEKKEIIKFLQDNGFDFGK